MRKPAVVLAAADPWHRHEARRLGGGLALDDPLVAEILFRLPLLGEIVLEDREDVAAPLNLVGDGLAAALDLRDALAEARDAPAHAGEMVCSAGRIDSSPQNRYCARSSASFSREA